MVVSAAVVTAGVAELTVVLALVTEVVEITDTTSIRAAERGTWRQRQPSVRVRV